MEIFDGESCAPSPLSFVFFLLLLLLLLQLFLSILHILPLVLYLSLSPSLSRDRSRSLSLSPLMTKIASVPRRGTSTSSPLLPLLCAHACACVNFFSFPYVVLPPFFLSPSLRHPLSFLSLASLTMELFRCEERRATLSLMTKNLCCEERSTSYPPLRHIDRRHLRRKK